MSSGTIHTGILTLGISCLIELGKPDDFQPRHFSRPGRLVVDASGTELVLTTSVVDALNFDIESRPELVPNNESF